MNSLFDVILEGKNRGGVDRWVKGESVVQGHGQKQRQSHGGPFSLLLPNESHNLTAGTICSEEVKAKKDQISWRHPHLLYRVTVRP